MGRPARTGLTQFLLRGDRARSHGSKRLGAERLQRAGMHRFYDDDYGIPWITTSELRESTIDSGVTPRDDGGLPRLLGAQGVSSGSDPHRDVRSHCRAARRVGIPAATTRLVVPSMEELNSRSASSTGGFGHTDRNRVNGIRRWTTEHQSGAGARSPRACT